MTARRLDVIFAGLCIYVVKISVDVNTETYKKFKTIKGDIAGLLRRNDLSTVINAQEQLLGVID